MPGVGGWVVAWGGVEVPGGGRGPSMMGAATPAT